MTKPSENRWDYLIALDDELLLGNVLVSEWAAFVIREADMAFAMGADLASILTAVSAIETHLRAEYGNNSDRLVQLIDRAAIDEGLRGGPSRSPSVSESLGACRLPHEDSEVLEHPEGFEAELASRATLAARILRRTLYHEQGT